MKRLAAVLMLLALASLAACTGGQVRRVSEPAASIQQLTVLPDGRWSLDLRVQNYSSISMQFGRVQLALDVDGQAAGTVSAAPNMAIGPEAADVFTVAFAPSAEGRIAMANALADRRSINYTLTGAMEAVPDGKKLRRFDDIKRSSALSPVPGLPGVLR